MVVAEKNVGKVGAFGKMLYLLGKAWKIGKNFLELGKWGNKVNRWRIS